MTLIAWKTLIIVLLFMAMTLSGKFDLKKGVLISLVLFLITGVLDIGEAMDGFTNTAFIVVLAMIPIASLLTKTDAVQGIKNRVVKLSKQGGKDHIVAILMLLSGAILGCLIPSPTTNMAILIGFLEVLGDDTDVTLTRMIVPLAWIDCLFRGRFPIGSTGTTAFARSNAVLEAAGVDSAYMLTLLDFMKVTAIPAIIGLLYAIFTWKMLPKSLDKKAKQSIQETKSEITAGRPAGGKKQAEMLTKPQQYVVYVSFILSVVALAIANKIGEIAYAVPVACLVALNLCGAIEGKALMRQIADGPAFSIVGIFALVAAVSKSGLGEIVGNGLLKALGDNPSAWWLTFICCFVTALVSSFTNNLVAKTVVQTLVASMAAAGGFDPRGLVCVISLGCAATVLTPMAHTGAAVAYGTSGLTVKDTFVWAFLGMMVVVVAGTVSCMLIYPPF